MMKGVFRWDEQSKLEQTGVSPLERIRQGRDGDCTEDRIHAWTASVSWPAFASA
jgi:hypothetical protein